jgi:putative PEP-CTERM system histidine kinase
MLNSIAFSSYALCASAFLALSILLFTRWRNNVNATATTVAALITASWAAGIALNMRLDTPFFFINDVLELFRNAAWTYVLIKLQGAFKPAEVTSFSNLRPLVKLSIGLYLVMLCATIYRYSQPVGDTTVIPLMGGILGRVAISVIGMLLVEQIYRNAETRERWGIKFACLGIGGMFAYDFYLFSDALLFRTINAEMWIARGAINALTAPLIALSAARNPAWSLRISVSRSAMFHSVALIGSAIYLLAMAGAGYYLRFFGGTWGNVMQGAFLFGAILLLLAVLFSGTFRSWLRVFVSKHFYSYNYDYREEWLRFTKTLSEGGPQIAERALQAVAALVESPAGALYLHRDSGNYELVTRWNLAVSDAPIEASSVFCQFLKSRQWVIDILELRRSPELYDGMALPSCFENVDSVWLVIPLVLSSDLRGFILLGRARSPVRLNWEVTDLLKIAGSQAASYLAQQETANSLMVARQFESFNRMSTFLVHDLKNLVSQLSLLVTNAAKHRDNPEFQRDMLETVELSVQKMRLLLHKLARSSAVETPVHLHLEKLLNQAIAIRSGADPRPTLEIEDTDLMVFANPARLERVIGHVIQNAIEATPKNGAVTVRLFRKRDDAVIECCDSGQGMSQDFIRDRLFKPFESTKAAGMGIGVFESREYIQELGGRIEVVSAQPGGTTFKIILPLQTSDQTLALHEV